MKRLWLVGLGLCIVWGCSKSANSPTSPSAIGVQQISVAGGASTALSVGGIEQLRATAVMSDGTSHDITNLASWTSDNPSAVTVTAGLVRAAAPGTATVGVSYQNSQGAFAVSVSGGTGGGSSGGASGSGTSSDPPSGSSGTGSSSGSGGSSSGGGSGGGSGPGGSGPGSSDGSTGGNDGSNSGSGGDPGGASTPAVTSLSVSGAPMLGLGDNSQFHVIATLSDGSRQDVTGDAAFSSSNPLIAAISKSGSLHAQGLGAALVTATYGGQSISTPVLITGL